LAGGGPGAAGGEGGRLVEARLHPQAAPIAGCTARLRMLLSDEAEGHMSNGFEGKRRFDLGRVIERTFGAIGAHGLPLFLMAVIFVGLPQVALAWGQSQFIAANTDLMTAGVIVWLISLVVGVICNVIMQGVVTHTVVADLQGRKSTIGESLGAGLRSFWVLLGVGIVAGLAMMLGFVLLVVPGILIMLVWLVAGPVVVAEGAGVGRALQRSRDLTRNHRWWLLLLTVVYVVISWIIGIMIGIAGMAAIGFEANGGLNFVTLVLAPLAQAISTLLWASIIAATYVELRTVKEGGGQTIAAIFD
jgi:hypothetical protein